MMCIKVWCIHIYCMQCCSVVPNILIYYCSMQSIAAAVESSQKNVDAYVAGNE